MVQRIRSTNFSSAAVLAQSTGRVGVPVIASQAIYANFEHVYGYANENGVSIDRIKILDSLIDRLSSIKSDAAFSSRKKADARGLSPERLDAMIEQYSKELRTVQTAPLASYRPSPLPAAMAFDLVA